MSNLLATVIEVDPRCLGVCAMIRKGRKYLACMRTGCRDMNGMWQFPGGAIERGESSVHAISREVLEETGLWTQREKFECLGVAMGRNELGQILVTTAFKSQWPHVRRPENKEPHKHSDWHWLTKKQLLDGRPLMPICEYFLRKNK